MNTFTNTLPEIGYIKITHICGDKKRGIVGVYPVSRASWYDGIKKGKYPKGVNLGGGRSVAWRVEDIRALIVATGGEVV